MFQRPAVVLATFAFALAASYVPAQETSRPASKPARPDIYDTKRDGQDLVAAASKKAAKDDKRVLVVFGGNWCGWCHKLHELFRKNREVATAIRSEYEVAWVDVGTRAAPRNLELAKSYVEKMESFPWLTVLDSAGTVLANQETGALEAGDGHDPAKVLAFLEKWRVPAKSADQVLAEAMARAKNESKMLFFHVGAPW
jgi:thioredoxin-related protein